MLKIIGLVPENPTLYTKVAHQLFSEMSDGYLLSANVHPHITITQFISDNDTLLNKIWQDISLLQIKSFSPQLNGVNFIKGTGAHEGFYWAQVGVERDPAMMTLHRQMIASLKKFDLKCINDIEDNYKPHLTLARIKLTKIPNLWPDEILSKQTFTLALGAADQNGRFLETLAE